jgi:2,4-dienoyl-CoA reductase (NADPH2)
VSDERSGATAYRHVFQRLTIGPVEVENRIFMAPHGIGLEARGSEHETHSVPAIEHAHYFAERARGGVGLIFHSMPIAPFALQPTLTASPGLPQSVASYAKVAELVHEAGAKIMAEIWYIPWQPHKWEALGPDAPQLAPSPLPNYALPSTRHAMRKRDIERFVGAHAAAVANLRSAGYDGIELHVSHGALLEYFLSPYFNKRTDEYGGSLENRARLLVECLETVRATAGPGLAVGIRLTADQMLSGGFTEDGCREILEYLAPTGLLDFVDLDISVEPDQVHLMTPSFFEPRLHNATRVASVAAAARPLVVIASPGRLTNLADADRLIESGSMDMVGIVRGLIAEPQLVNNARDGRASESRICIAANHCNGGLVSGPGWGCAINPVAGREDRWSELGAAATPLKVVVVGGGPAGLEAARISAARGNSVTLLERRGELGGGVRLWSMLPGRESLASLGGWFEGRLSDLDVEVRTGVEATAESVLALGPDVVFVATGSEYARDGESGFDLNPIKGWDSACVVPFEDVLESGRTLAGRVVVLDEESMHAAAGIAELAAAAGAQVDLVTRKMVVGDALARQARYIEPRLHAAGVTVRRGSWIREISDSDVTIVELLTGRKETVPVDAVVLATVRKPVDSLADELEGKVRFVYLIGDALAPRSLREATYEGHRFGRVIGDADMPESVTDELYKPLNTLVAAEHA